MMERQHKSQGIKTYFRNLVPLSALAVPEFAGHAGTGLQQSAYLRFDPLLEICPPEAPRLAERAMAMERDVSPVAEGLE
ncbi:MAG: hypothetical protein H6851_02835 [Geminicoccaceae bacterium]|nr:hypothetical protein [Geminicoccaceae bacterium]